MFGGLSDANQEKRERTEKQSVACDGFTAVAIRLSITADRRRNQISVELKPTPVQE
jgi:hypothetical protein